jgi:hypothetical protein
MHMTGERQYSDSHCLFEKRLCFGYANAPDSFMLATLHLQLAQLSPGQG